MEPNIHYVNSLDEVRIAYSTLGAGPVLLVMPVLPTGHLELEWHMPERREWYMRMADHHTVVRYDPRGAGLSTRSVKNLSCDAHFADLEAVVERVAGDSSVAILARHLAGPLAVKYAAMNQDRVSRLILWHSFAKGGDYATVARTEAIQSLVTKDWEVYTESVATFTVASQDYDMNRRYAAYMRGSSEPDQYERSLANLNAVDCSEYLPCITSPTLVLQRRDVQKFDPTVTRSLAAAIPDARLALVNGTSWAMLAEDVSNVTQIIEEFLAGAPDIYDSELRSVSFTEREEQVLRLLSAGLHNRAIADQLSVSVHTVDRHIANIYLKLGVHNRVEAATYALRHGKA